MVTIEDNIHKVWDVEQEILDVIHSICAAHGLRYSLAYGTLIGAVRHGGFIPWDDDIDLMMPRDDYEKFLSIWASVAPKGYILQNKYTDPDFTQTFTKIRKDHTTFLQNSSEQAKAYHKGIFVDIFPGDRVAPGKASRLLQYLFSAVSLLYARGFCSNSGRFVGFVEHCLLTVPSQFHMSLYHCADRLLSRWNHCTDAPYFFPSTISSARIYYPSDMFHNLSTISFCGKEYFCFANPDQILQIEYGDYMKFPPVEDRVWKHHPIIIDFEHSYEELTQGK